MTGEINGSSISPKEIKSAESKIDQIEITADQKGKSVDGKSISEKFSNIYSRLEKEVTQRQICAQCGRKRMYFCYDCRQLMPGIEALVPKIKLPVQIDVIKHQGEKNSKSTAIHCCLLAPESTRIFDRFMDIPDYSNTASSSQDPVGSTVLVYPSKNAESIEEYVLANGPIGRLVFVDGTWYNVKTVRNLPQLAGLPCVKLKMYTTDYWRPQKGLSAEYLATIEAIFYALSESFKANKSLAKSDEIIAGTDLDTVLFWFYFLRSRLK
ncbi:DTW domain-containing protein [Ditylenchus destructor]|uniref:tRNA-uridine aminocarboxypropyltransferase 1 n=1 Tax=Ditylenchus destructor TaxID=166010 RepID=A0AAD4R7E8_9BILA|nr:DTW domain-containing protein [Ditylenchus destructor]